jgi:lambda family phage tail tape measure protein
MQSSMSDAFMSMVDGTKSFKDAMKDMAKSVIKQLFDILVVQRLVGSFDNKSGKGSGIVGAIMSAIPQADGGAWQGGSQIKAYADGGVVGGPTYFPMTGGKTGLMGEAGPEAIMPLKRGANGKLGVQMEGGAGGDTVVNNYFNVSANGDDSVKRIIRGEIPRITEATKAAVVDAKRRGGSYGRSF